MYSRLSSSLWEELLPGIHDDITLTHIAARLPWTAFYILSSVSRTWKRAIESREVHGERMRSHSTETLVVVKHCDVKHRRNAISLYSMRLNTFYQLPPIPHLRGISRFSQFVSTNGRLYVLGAHCQCKCDVCSVRCIGNQDIQVYVLDLAGRGQWKECTDIPPPEPDSKESFGHGFRNGEKHFWRGGSAEWCFSAWNIFPSVEGSGEPDVYKGKLVGPSEVLPLDQKVEKHFLIHGKFYSMRPNRGKGEIHVYDMNKKSWTRQHSISCDVKIKLEAEPEVGATNALTVDPLLIIPVENELVALVRWSTRSGFHDYCLLQSRGFGTTNIEIVWQKAPQSFNFDPRTSFAMCPIQL